MRFVETEELYKKRNTWGNSGEIWKNEKLKSDFRDIFHNKCWYTEVRLVGQDVHIDHFRPKSEVTLYKDYHYNEPLKSSGYYWLKNDVSNYRACCIYANRKTGEGGKGTYFPLKRGSLLLFEGGSNDEESMLLDPLKKEDVKLITFFGGQIECATEDEYEKQRVQVSKKIYNLIDPYIKKERLSVWDNVEKIIEEYKVGEISRGSCVRQLRKAVSREEPFSACAVACVNSLAPDDIKAELDLEL